MSLRRRDFIAGLGGAAAWPLTARAQPSDRMRRLGFLWSAFSADDAEGQARGTAFVQGLQELGWRLERNLRIDYRWGLLDHDRLRRSAEELSALAPDALFAAGEAALAALQQATRTLPIVFANVTDPVGAGYVESLARPGGNTTGFMNIEYSQSGKWLELLKEIKPSLKRVAILGNAVESSGPSQFAAMQAVAPLLGVEVIPIKVRSTADIEHALAEFARAPNGGLIVTFGVVQRNLILDLTARHRLPAVYFTRSFVTEGGLISYGPDLVDQRRPK
jgi:putative ABC transport system substrate-binding protein